MGASADAPVLLETSSLAVAALRHRFTTMSAVTGILLFAFAVFIFGVALVAARKPNAPNWLTEGFAGSLITITATALAVTGLGLIGQFAASYGREALGTKEVVLISINVILLIGIFVGIVKALRRSATIAVAEPSSVGNAPSVAADSSVAVSVKEEEPSMAIKHGPSRSSRRRRFGTKHAA